MCREPARQPFPRSQRNSLRCTNWPCQFETLYIKKARKGLGCLPPSSRPRAGPSCLSSLLPSPAAHPASEPPGLLSQKIRLWQEQGAEGIGLPAGQTFKGRGETAGFELPTHLHTLQWPKIVLLKKIISLRRMFCISGS